MNSRVQVEKEGRRWDFANDLIPGLTTAAVVVPKALAYATIALLPVQAGLYAAILPMAVYAILGTSRLLSVSTTTPIAILCATSIGEALRTNPALDPLTAAATLSVLVGAMLLVARILRLGFLANFISDPVLTGFKAGVGLVIVVDQLPKLLGVHIHKEGFFRDVISILEHVLESSRPTLAVALGTFAIIALAKRFLPKFPAPLIAVALGIAATAALGLEAAGVSVVSDLEQRASNAVSIADANLVIGQAVHCEVLTKLSERKIFAAELRLPVAIGLHLIHHHRPVFAAMPRQIPLTVSLHIQAADGNPALHRLLPNGSVDFLALPCDVSRKPDVD